MNAIFDEIDGIDFPDWLSSEFLDEPVCDDLDVFFDQSDKCSESADSDLAYFGWSENEEPEVKCNDISIDEQLRVLGSFQDDQFFTRYQRNNKCSGLKNLRCFPNCGPDHRERRFCGQSIIFNCEHDETVKVTKYGSVADDGVVKELVAWGRFDTLEPQCNDISVGCIVEQSSIVSLGRKRGQPCLPWYSSKVSNRKSSAKGKESMTFEFNSEYQGWHYAWAATKYTCESEHVFRSYVFTVLPDGKYLCLGIFDSPSFMIYCRRRQRFNRPQMSDTSSISVVSRVLAFITKAIENLNDPLYVPPSGKLQCILNEFAKHVIEEKAFTESVSELCKSVSFRKNRGESSDIGFKEFIAMVETYLKGFFEQRNMSLADAVPRIAKPEEVDNHNTSDMLIRGSERQLRMAFLKLLKSHDVLQVTCKRKFKEEESSCCKKLKAGTSVIENWDVSDWKGFDPTKTQAADISGMWLRSTVNSDGMLTLREKRHVPLVHRGVLKHMESDIRMEQSEDSLKIHLRQKFLADGFIEYLLDGKEYPFDLQHPLLGSESSKLAISKQAWLIGNAVCVRHNYTKTQRISRLHWLSDRENLVGRYVYESFSEGKWNVETVIPAHSTRMP